MQLPNATEINNRESPHKMQSHPDGTSGNVVETVPACRMRDNRLPMSIPNHSTSSDFPECSHIGEAPVIGDNKLLIKSIFILF